MITRIEIDGFKSFHDFSVDLKPFQVLIGPNGVGKSNLFDAITLLSHLVHENSLYEAFRHSRGSVEEQFPRFGDGTLSTEMRFAVELLLPRTVRDSFGNEEEVSATRVRYELHILRREENGLGRLYVSHESLNAITEDDDRWFRDAIPAKHRKSWIIRGRRTPYISIADSRDRIYVHQDGRSGRKQQINFQFAARTVLSTISSVEYTTALAVKRAISEWQFLQLNPEALRAPSDIYASEEMLSDGSNLATVLHRMASEAESALNDVSLTTAGAVPGIKRVGVEIVPEERKYLISAEMTDQQEYSSRVLSDGTLRILTLAVLRNDPRRRGVICLEEPENGVHPDRIPVIIDLLRSMATDFQDAPEDVPLPRQILINTHSPKVAACVEDKAILMVYMPGGKRRITRMMPVTSRPELPPESDRPLAYFTRHQLDRYLDAPTERERLEVVGMGE
ncbi:MAG: AAA family ATPase [Anaerolineae bacterium]|nr:AAA family ATPase [Anaerolineae bacterium]